ncbi:MAG: hypothetical protein OEW91_14910, partial [Acidimicrobiia bacterium]|nr:hypothetical protein [Acidimicrobiia bacterium]
DGVQVATTPDTIGDTSNSDALLFGRDAATNSWSEFDGNLDEIKIYGYALTPAEIAVLAQASTGTVVVNSTGNASDSNPGDDVCDTGGAIGSDPECTFRAAIQEANASAAIDTIHFNIPTTAAGHSGGVWTISPTSALPSVSAPVTLDATTQPGWTANPIVRLDGASAGSVSGLSVGGAADGSVIDGLMVTRFGVDGVWLASGADGVTVARTWIGTNGSGASSMGNGDDGIDINGINAVIDRNVVNHSGDEGIDVRANGATITGNIIGLEPDGSSGSGNIDVGIALFGANTTIGGSTSAARNIISNNYEGIEVSTSGNVIRGNYIGTDGTGTLNRKNRIGDGIEILSGTGNIVGGTAPGQGNLIAFNQLKGVDVTGGTGNTVLGNHIHSNGGLGIDLGSTGVTPNDAGDGDTGANDLLNFPVITSAVETGGTVTVTYDLDVPAGTYRVEFFESTAADASGYGEGETFVAAATATPGTGRTHSFAGSAGDLITATATRIDLGAATGFSSTSEFSAEVTVTGDPLAPELWLSTAADVGSPSGVSAVDSWSAGALLGFGDPGLALGPGTTGGTMSLVSDFDDQGQDGNVVLIGLHLVQSTISVGTSPPVTLQPATCRSRLPTTRRSSTRISRRRPSPTRTSVCSGRTRRGTTAPEASRFFSTSRLASARR